ncbi:MAG: V-type ATPase subunit, partial [Oscillospiraceae bacterium]|nr:V-type ATPase subunit [Oscillospiraceae bacterium]
YLIKKASFDLINLAKAKDFNQLLSGLKGSIYHDIIKDVTVLENGQVDFTECEMKLRSYYQNYIYELANKGFKGQDRNQLLNIFKVQSDLINIINIYRMKEYFKMSEEDMLKNILAVKGRLSTETEQALLTAPNIDTFMKVLSKTSYGKGLEGMKEFEAIYFENKLSRLRSRMSKRALATSQSAAVSLYCAMYLLEVEINNIILIIEGIRYEKPQSYLEELIIYN